MLRIQFKNLEKSELAKEIVSSRLEELSVKFPELSSHKMTVTLSMYNSPQQAGPDEFRARLQLVGKKFDNIVVEKKAFDLYAAVGNLSEALLERLNRKNDKVRVINRARARKLQDKLIKSSTN